MEPEDRLAISVLLVEDQRFVGVAIERLLASESDIVLHCCFSAVEAVACANQLGPTLILQDLVLRDCDGLALVRMFRANPSTAATPIIVLSGSDDAETRRRAIAGGADDSLVKLPAGRDLIACIRRHAAATLVPDPNAPPLELAATTIAAEPDPDETLDRRVLASFRQPGAGGVPEFIQALIDQFLEEAAGQMEMLRDSGQRLDVGRLKAAAHSLKGSSMTIGANRLGALCRQVEDRAERDPDGALAPALMAQLDQEFVKVCNALEAERQENASQL